jgi:hypothetical protein
MSLNHIVLTKELDAYFKKLNVDSIDLNGTNLLPAPLPVRQFATTYTMSPANTITTSTNLYYTSDTNELRMRGRVNFQYNGITPMEFVALIFLIPDEFKSFQVDSTPIFSGYVAHQYPNDEVDTNALLNQVINAGPGQVVVNYTFATTQTAPKPFTLVFDVSLIKNL